MRNPYRLRDHDHLKYRGGEIGWTREKMMPWSLRDREIEREIADEERMQDQASS